MPSFITQVTYFRFGAKVKYEEPCSGDIRAGQMAISYKLEGEPEVTASGGPDTNQPPPAPPAPEPDLEAPVNPVILLFNNGWRPRATHDDYIDPPGSQQPAAFGRSGIFEKLKLDFVFPAFCRCDVPNGPCRVARFKLSVNYDGTAHPTAKLSMSRVSDNCPQYFTLDPTERPVAATLTLNSRVPLSDCVPEIDDIPDFFTEAGGGALFTESVYANRDALGAFQNIFSWSVPLPCVCPPGPGNQQARESECTVNVSCVYNYRNRKRD